MSQISEHEIWIRFKDGDDNALSQLFSLYAHDLYSYGLKIINNQSLVQDSVQEVFIKLIHKRQSLVVTSKIHIYLFKSLRNQLLEELRSAYRKQDILKLIFSGDQYFDDTIEEAIIHKEERKKIKEQLNTALKKLTSHQKEVIYLKYTEGFSNAEISKLLNIDRASVRTLIYRSLKSIKENLDKNTYGDNNGLILMLCTYLK